MKIILTSIGSRGDIEPFLAIAQILSKRGHDVLCAFPEQFRNLAEDSNVAFASLGTKFVEMLDSADGKAVLGGGGSRIKKIFAYLRLARHSVEINKELLTKQREIIEPENPDRIVHNAKAMYPIIWGLHNKGKTTLVSPVPYLHYEKNHAHVAFGGNYGPFLNRLTYILANYAVITTIVISIKWLRLAAKVPRKQVKNAWFTNKIIYTISPALFSRPDCWSANIQVVGFHERDKTVNWKAEKDLEEFIATHRKIILVTFGSMTNPNPEEKTELVLAILKKHNIAAIINTSSGGLVETIPYDSKLFFFVKQIPYDWAFPKMYGVVHHGGSGTTHMTMKYGCASLIVPHIVDQYVWNDLVSEKGAGPKGESIAKLTRENFEKNIVDLMQNISYKAKAEQISQVMKGEDYTDELCKMIVGD